MSVLIPTDFRHGWAIFWPSGGQKHLKGGVTRAPSQRKVFQTFLYLLWDISFKLGIYIKWVVSHVKFEFHSDPDTLTNFTAKNRSVIYLHSWLQKLYRGFRFGTHTQIVSVLTPVDFCHAWAVFGPLVGKNTRKGELVELPASDTWGLSFVRIRSLPLKNFLDFFLNVLPSQLESWFIHWVGCTTYWVHVSLEWEPCDLLHVLSLGTVK